MAITHFRISKLPERVTCLKNGVAITLNQSYPLAEQNEITYDNQTGFKNEFLDSMQIEVSENESQWSNPSTVAIKELVGINTPESAELIVTASKNANYDFSGIAINNSTDRIRIEAIEGYGTLTLNGDPVFVGDIIYNYQLSLLVFATDNGAGLPYGTISYHCGNHIGFNEATVYQTIFNISSLAEISSSGVDGDNPVYDNVLIENGLSGKTALITVNVSGNMFANGATSEIRITYGTFETIISANGSQQINVPLDIFGTSDIEIEHNYSNFGTSATSTVQLTIDEVDGEASNVSVTNTYTSTINF
tara:strand:- start:49459 stop:50376 length:918 start_codon:yes stop_codon:yes gene_type:complete